MLDDRCYAMPTIAFHLPDTDPVDSGDPLWRQPLPDKRPSGFPGPQPADSGSITYGDYFSAVAQFCSTAGWGLILNAASRDLSRPVDERELQTVSICLEKHGAFYHPARLHVRVADRTLSLVVNVAVSAHGQQSLPREIKALARLNTERPFGWLPEVYGHAAVKLSGGKPLPMFMANWFDGFHEFHLTRLPGSHELAIVIWDGSADPCLLSKAQMADLYRDMAMILAACYDPITTRQIFPWHHAAGDFVVKTEGNRTRVRLITVRDHAPLVTPTQVPENEGALLDTLVLFFIHLSIRMRLDRLDGVGEIVWAPQCCLEPTISGFFQGLDLTARLSDFPEDFPDLFRHYFIHHGMDELLAVARRVTETVFDRRTEEHRIISSHLDKHIRHLYRILAG